MCFCVVVSLYVLCFDDEIFSMCSGRWNGIERDIHRGVDGSSQHLQTQNTTTMRRFFDQVLLNDNELNDSASLPLNSSISVAESLRILPLKLFVHNTLQTQKLNREDSQQTSTAFLPLSNTFIHLSYSLTLFILYLTKDLMLMLMLLWTGSRSVVVDWLRVGFGWEWHNRNEFESCDTWSDASIEWRDWTQKEKMLWMWRRVGSLRLNFSWWSRVDRPLLRHVVKRLSLLSVPTSIPTKNRISETLQLPISHELINSSKVSFSHLTFVIQHSMNIFSSLHSSKNEIVTLFSTALPSSVLSFFVPVLFLSLVSRKFYCYFYLVFVFLMCRFVSWNSENLCYGFVVSMFQFYVVELIGKNFLWRVKMGYPWLPGLHMLTHSGPS